MRHVRRKAKWQLYATTTAYILGLTMFAYWTINANPLMAGIMALAAAAAMGLHIYYQDRRRP